ncbi:MAG: hypothetical protein DVB26_07295 [Verrucomicrobia bacterium]|nr:MAG: hypothetical protein DVB26_07295 [Verrucomicrobiota bacterium]
MKSRATYNYWTLYRQLPVQIRHAALKQYRLWLTDPRHPSIQFKKIGLYWSARVTADYRALGITEAHTVIWFWIGNHHEYGPLLRGR